MCQFFSSILMKNGDLLWSPYTDSHEDLVSANNLHDTMEHRFARLEFAPPEVSLMATVDAYTLHVDEAQRPDWLTEGLAEKTLQKLRSIIARMIVTDKRSAILGGCWILADGARVDNLKWARVPFMLDSSQVGVMWESSQVGTMLNSSHVGTMWDYSQVGVMLDSSQVGVMWESSQVGTMLNSSQVGVMRDSSQVGVMWESSQVGVMWESSQVGTMLNSSHVGTMWDYSQVGAMRDSSQAPRKPKNQTLNKV